MLLTTVRLRQRAIVARRPISGKLFCRRRGRRRARQTAGRRPRPRRLPVIMVPAFRPSAPGGCHRPTHPTIPVGVCWALSGICTSLPASQPRAGGPAPLGKLRAGGERRPNGPQRPNPAAARVQDELALFFLATPVCGPKNGEIGFVRRRGPSTSPCGRPCPPFPSSSIGFRAWDFSSPGGTQPGILALFPRRSLFSGQ